MRMCMRGSGSNDAVCLAEPELLSALAACPAATFTAGGDCCARANYMGAMFGAKFGIEAIPMEWIEKVTNIGPILENTVKVFASSK